MSCRPNRRGRAVLGIAAALLSILAPAGAQAARLLGGRGQSSVLRAFAAEPGHRADLVVSVRASTTTPGWAVARWVVPSHGDPATRQTVPALHSSYFRLAGGVARAATPPSAARRELQAPFRVALLYRGSGSEAISYTQTLRSGCNPNGDYLDQEKVTVKPMSWSVRYVVALDQLQAATVSPSGTAALPTVSFDRTGSQLLASEQLTRTTVDQGCFGTPSTIGCTHSFHLSQADAADYVSLAAERGTEIGVPFAIGSHGDCTPEDYPLGPSLWESGANTALVRGLNLTGRLPANPYAPIRVRWPAGSASQQGGFLASPCQGITASCHDSFGFSGRVQLVPVSG